MNKDDNNKKIFSKLSDIINKNYEEKINLYISSFIEKNPLSHKDLIKTDKNRFNYSYNSYIRKQPSISAGEYFLQFCPLKKKLTVMLPDEKVLKFSSSSDKDLIFLEVHFSTDKIMKISFSRKKGSFLKFAISHYRVVCRIFKRNVFFMIFDIRNVQLQEDLLLFYSQEAFKLYIRKEIYELKNKRDREEPEKFFHEPHMYSVDPVGLELGRGLLPLIDPNRGSYLLKRITSIRRHLKEEMGINIPPVRIRDNLIIQSNRYIIKIKDVEVASGEVVINKFLAIGYADLIDRLKGKKCFEPTYNLPAIWITADLRGEAERMGCMVFDPVSVMATQITETLRAYSPILMNREEMSAMISELQKKHPVLVDEIYRTFPLSKIQAVFRNLLQENIPVKDIATIIETMADYSHITKDTDLLTEYVRERLKLFICSYYKDFSGEISAITIKPEVEEMLSFSVERTEYGSFMVIRPKMREKLISTFREILDKNRKKGLLPVILCSPQIRAHIKRLMMEHDGVPVLSYSEICCGVKVNILHSVSLEEDISKENTSQEKEITGNSKYRSLRLFPGKENTTVETETGKDSNKKVELLKEESKKSKAKPVCIITDLSGPKEKKEEKSEIVNTSKKLKDRNNSKGGLKEKVFFLINNFLDSVIDYSHKLKEYFKVPTCEEEKIVPLKDDAPLPSGEVYKPKIWSPAKVRAFRRQMRKKAREDGKTLQEVKIDMICNKIYNLSPKEAEEALDKFQGNTVKAIIYLKKLRRRKVLEALPEEARNILGEKLQAKLDYIIQRTGISEIEALKILVENDWNDIEAIIKIENGKKDDKKITEKSLKVKIFEVIKNNIKKNRDKLDYIQEKTGVTEEEALKALLENDGNKVKAVLSISVSKIEVSDKNIDYICNETGVLREEARKAFLENRFDKIKAVKSIKEKKYKDQSFIPEDNSEEEKVLYICRRTKVSEEEAKKFLKENDNDEIEAVMSIKKVKRRIRPAPVKESKNKTKELISNFSKEKILDRANEILKDNIKKKVIDFSHKTGLSFEMSEKILREYNWDGPAVIRKIKKDFFSSSPPSVNKKLDNIYNILDTTPEMKNKVKKKFSELKDLLGNIKSNMDKKIEEEKSKESED